MAGPGRGGAAGTRDATRSWWPGRPGTSGGGPDSRSGSTGGGRRGRSRPGSWRTPRPSRPRRGCGG
jgi:hypothetical protein